MSISLSGAFAPYSIVIHNSESPEVAIYTTRPDSGIFFKNATEVVAFFEKFVIACETAFGEDELQDAWDVAHGDDEDTERPN